MSNQNIVFYKGSTTPSISNLPEGGIYFNTSNKNIYLNADGENIITYKGIDTTYSSKSASSDGTALSLVTTGEKYIWNNKSDKHNHPYLSDTTKYAASSSVGGSATSAIKLDSSAGSATQPVYFSSGKPTACSYTLNCSVPANATFTDSNVNQLVSSSTSYRPLLLGASGQTNPVNFTDTNASSYYCKDIYAVASSGTLVANKLCSDNIIPSNDAKLTFNDIGWYRIGKIVGSGKTILLTLSSGFNNYPYTSVTLLISVGYNSTHSTSTATDMTISQLSSCSNRSILSDVRIVCYADTSAKTTTLYIEGYYRDTGGSYSDTLYMSAIGGEIDFADSVTKISTSLQDLTNNGIKFVNCTLSAGRSYPLTSTNIPGGISSAVTENFNTNQIIMSNSSGKLQSSGISSNNIASFTLSGSTLTITTLG